MKRRRETRDYWKDGRGENGKMYRGTSMEVQEELTAWRIISFVVVGVFWTILIYVLVVAALLI